MTEFGFFVNLCFLSLDPFSEKVLHEKLALQLSKSHEEISPRHEGCIHRQVKDINLQIRRNILFGARFEQRSYHEDKFNIFANFERAQQC